MPFTGRMCMCKGKACFIKGSKHQYGLLGDYTFLNVVSKAKLTTLDSKSPGIL